MTTQKRPGGLTALAVFNFIFAALGIIGALAIFALVGMVSAAQDAATASGASSVDIPGLGTVYASLALWVLTIGLLLASGIGYLGQKAFLGRTLGNAYGVLAILNNVIGLTMLQQSFGVVTIISLTYPILTLLLLNTVFKDSFQQASRPQVTSYA